MKVQFQPRDDKHKVILWDGHFHMVAEWLSGIQPPNVVDVKPGIYKLETTLLNGHPVSETYFLVEPPSTGV